MSTNDGHTQFQSFKRLPQLPSASNTPNTKSPALSTLRESSTNSHLSKLSKSTNDRDNDNRIERSQTNSSKFDHNCNDSSIFKRFKRERGSAKSDINIDEIENDIKEKEKSISGKSKIHSSNLHSINETKEKSISGKGKTVPLMLSVLPLKHTTHSYSQIADDEDASDDDIQNQTTENKNENTYELNEDRITLTTNINDNTTGTDASNKRRKIFRRKRRSPKNINDELSEDEETSKYNDTEISKSATDLSNILTATKSKSKSKFKSKSKSRKSHKESKKDMYVQRERRASNAASSSMTSKTSKTSNVSNYSMRDELNLQRIIINATTEMHAAVALPQKSMSRTEGSEVRDDIFDNNNNNKEPITDYNVIFKLKQKRKDTLNGFEFYFKLRNVLSLLTLIAVGTMQLVYYRYYYLCSMFTIITCVGYILLFIPKIYKNSSGNNWYRFSLIVIRLFHIMSILLIFGGVETCLWHYENAIHKQQNSQNGSEYNNNSDLDIYMVVLWIFIISAIIICYLHNVYVIQYNEYTVTKWKLIYCRTRIYYINDDGTWRADVHPIGADGVLTLLLFITTLGAIITAVVQITQMEQYMKIYGV